MAPMRWLSSVLSVSSASSSRRSTFTWDGVVDWLLGPGLSIVFIVLGAMVVRWFVHRSTNGLVSSIVTRRQSTTDSGSIMVVDPVPTMQLPVMRRQARRAARVLTRSGIVVDDEHGGG